MRILFVTNQLAVGGIEKNTVRLTGELSRRGHTVVAATSGGSLVGDLRDAGGEHFYCPVKLSPLSLKRAVAILRSLVRERRPDVVHVFSASAAAGVFLAKKMMREPFPPVISSVMGLTTDPNEARWRVMARTFATSVGADKIIVMAPAIDEVVQGLRIAAHRLVHQSVVGVEVDLLRSALVRRREVRQSLGVDTDACMVLSVGGLVPSKSHHLFVEAAASSRHPDARFFIVGGGRLESVLEDQIATAGLEDRVELLGERNDVPDLMAATDVYVRPGTVEGFVGITVLEAQALSIPVVAFETEDVKLSIEHGRTGWLVPSGDAQSLATALDTLLYDASLRRRLGEAGADHVRQTFDLPQVVDRLEDLYRSVEASPGWHRASGGG